jgi:AhpD family alkylhydroperoxidase
VDLSPSGRNANRDGEEVGKIPGQRQVLAARHVLQLLRVGSSVTSNHLTEKEIKMQARIDSPALSVPGVLDALQSLAKAASEAGTKAGIPRATVDLVSLRASQINGCAVCLDMHTRAAKKAGESEERLFTLSAWRDTPYFSEAERAALALTEAGTRLADIPDPVSDDVFQNAARYYDEEALAALVVHSVSINSWNRLNVITGQVAGEWTAQWAG